MVLRINNRFHNEPPSCDVTSTYWTNQLQKHTNMISLTVIIIVTFDWSPYKLQYQHYVWSLIHQGFPDVPGGCFYFEFTCSYFCLYTGRSKMDSACWFSPSHIRGSDRMMTGMRKPFPETFCHIKTGLRLNLGLCNQKSYTNCIVVACAARSNDPEQYIMCIS